MTAKAVLKELSNWLYKQQKRTDFPLEERKHYSRVLWKLNSLVEDHLKESK